MKKYDFKKMAALGLTLGLSVAAPSSACCGRDKHDNNDSSELLSTLNKATEGFYLAGHGCGGSSSGCGGQSQSKGTGTSRGNVAMDDSSGAASSAYQTGRMQGSGQSGQMQGTSGQTSYMQGADTGSQMQGSRGYYQGSSGQSGQMQGGFEDDANNSMQNGTSNPNTMRQNYNNMRNSAPRTSGGCGGISSISGLNT